MRMSIERARVLDNYDQSGIDTQTPKFAWTLNADGRNEKQTAYRIIVSSNELNIDNNIGDIWDSHKVLSESQYSVTFTGSELNSSTKYWWKVMSWDREDHETIWSRKAEFITGIINNSDWNARWIQSSHYAASVPTLMRKEFNVTKVVKQAIAHVCGLGQFEFCLNGSKIGDHEYDPGWTDYEQSCLYITFDVTENITQGLNATSITLADGFFNCSDPKGRYSKFTNSFGQKRLIFQLDINYSDGTSTEVVSDTTWKTSIGPITYSYVYGGEDYDARLNKNGWMKPGYDDSDWNKAEATSSPGGILTSQKQPPLKIMNIYETVNVTQPAPREYVYDLGQSFSGFMEVTVSGTTGDTIMLMPSENLNANTDIDQESIGSPQWCNYTLEGQADEVWRTKFYYTGFRYVKVKGGSRTKGDDIPYIINIRGLNMYSSAEQVGNFSTSSRIYNEIHKMVLNSCKSNLQSVLTDCPHREKLGWLEVAHLMATSFDYNFDMQALDTKIAKDTTESQLVDGMVPCTAPEYTRFNVGMRDTCSWGSTSVIMPWYMYQIYGDAEILSIQYDTMKKYVEYLRNVAVNNHIIQGLGDWGHIEKCNNSLVETAHYYYDVLIVSKIANLLGYIQDFEYYSKLANKIKLNYNNADYWDSDSKCYIPKTQTHQAMPLYFGLVPSGCEENVLETLIDNIRINDYHVQTGEIGHRYLLQVLSQSGHDEIVDKIITNPTQPSFRYLVDIGKTSMPEYWDGSNSQQHAMMGHVEEWFYNSVAGIQQTKPGYEEFRISPTVTGELTWAGASVITIRGVVSSNWKRKGNTFTEDVVVPVNSCAKVYIPTFDMVNIIIKEGTTILWQNNSTTDSVAGVSYNCITDGFIVWNVGSGKYSFTITED